MVLSFASRFIYSLAIRYSIYSLIILGSALKSVMLRMTSVCTFWKRCVLFAFMTLTMCACTTKVRSFITVSVCFFSSSVMPVVDFLVTFLGTRLLRTWADLKAMLRAIYSSGLLKSGFLIAFLSTMILGLQSCIMAATKASLGTCVWSKICATVYETSSL